MCSPEQIATLITSDAITPNLPMIIRRHRSGMPMEISVAEVRQGIADMQIALDNALKMLNGDMSQFPQPRKAEVVTPRPLIRLYKNVW